MSAASSPQPMLADQPHCALYHGHWPMAFAEAPYLQSPR
jgi:hypothetical protein